MQHNVETIRELLATNDRAVGRALIVLRNRQTSDELGRIDRSCRFAASGRPMPENPPNGRAVAEPRVPSGWAQVV